MINATICVFCGSSIGNNPAHRAAARALGEGIARRGFMLMFGGGTVGLMGVAAQAAAAGGARVRGIIPTFLHKDGNPHKDLIVTPDMQARKFQMLAQSHAFVVLPGGIGTLDEFFEVMAEAQLGVHAKPIILVNIAGYYDTLVALLDHMAREGFVRADTPALYHTVPMAEDALVLLDNLLS
jgi:uncharacterized protein (TIGR00730 family)